MCVLQDLSLIRGLEQYVDNPDVLQAFHAIKVSISTGMTFLCESLFTCHFTARQQETSCRDC
jgi:hypothetical protein